MSRFRFFPAILLLLAASALCLGGCAAEAVPSAPAAAAGPPAATAAPAETVFPEAEPTAEPPSAEPAARQRAAALLAEMTETEKLYQLFVVYPEAVTGTTVTAAAATEAGTKPALAARPVGGFVYAEANFQSAAQAAEMIAAQQAASKIPLLTCVDEEGGRVTRLRSITGAPKAMYSYRDDGPETAYANAAAIAANLSSLGLNTDFAPVADVWSNSANTVIGDRAYSGDFETAAALVPAAVAGFRDGNIICTLKHFPGHGDTAEDSHYGTAVVRKTLDELQEQEFLPFAAGIAAGADMVMVGHLTVPEADGDTPATFSRTIVTGLLRDGLGFDGVVITDALAMAAATGYSAGGEACVRALAAGCDLLLGAAAAPKELDACVQAIRDELAAPGGRLTWEGIDGSVARVLAMKLEHGLIS